MGVKISGLTAKGATIADTDLVEVSQSAGAGLYTSRSVTGANIKALVTDANMTTSDITTNDVSTAKHGFAPKAPNDTTKFLRGDGTWAVPASGGLTEFTELETTAAPNATVPVNSLTPVTATTDADFAIVPKGNGAILRQIPDNTTAGGNKRGSYAIDFGYLRSSASQVASGSGATVLNGSNNTSSGSRSITGGNLNTASGNYSVALGSTNTASNSTAVAFGVECTSSGDSAFSAGYSNTASGNYSQAIGVLLTSSGIGSTALGYSNVANADHSVTLGTRANAFSVIGRQVFSSGQESTSGDSQASKFILRERTTNNTATTITTNSSAAGTTNQVILSNQSAYRFKGSIVGKQSGSVNAAVWDIDGFLVRGANAAATTLNVSNVTLVENTPAWGTPTLAADTTNGGLRVQVTGASATNIQWTAVIETTEVIYA
jgi:hypothetical protein